MRDMTGIMVCMAFDEVNWLLYFGFIGNMGLSITPPGSKRHCFSKSDPRQQGVTDDFGNKQYSKSLDRILDVFVPHMLVTFNDYFSSIVTYMSASE